MDKAIEQILERQHAWTQQMFSQQQQFFAEILSQQSSSPVMSVTSNSIAVPKFQQFDEESNDFDTYKRQLEEHFKAYNVDDDERKRSFFLSWIGDKSYRLLQKIVGKNGMVNLTYSDLAAKFDTHYKSKVHIIKSRYEFYKRNKREDESYKQWVTELRGMARECKFLCKRNECGCDFSDELIRDIIILYTPDESVKTAALHKDEPTLEEVLQIAETFEATQRTVKSIKSNDTGNNDIFVVKQGSRNQKYDHKNQTLNRSNENKKSSHQWPSCVGCFKNHDKSNCKYLKAQCFICKKIGHIASVCRFKSNSKNLVNSVEEEIVIESDSSIDENTSVFTCDAVDNIISRSGNKMVICVKINNQDMKFQFDTGAMRSVIGLESYKSLKSPILNSTSVKLFGYGNAQIPVLGSIKVNVQIQNECKSLDLIVADSNECSNIFGLNWYDEFKIIQIFKINENINLKSLCDEFKELFLDELGLCTTVKGHIYMKSDARPKFCKPRPIPYSMNETFKKEAERLTNLGIWKPVKFSQWASPLVIVPKANNKIRVCADFKITINPQMDVEQYPIPRIRDLFHKIKNGKSFSKIDLSDAYLQIEMDEESKKLLVVNTPLGLFEYQRLPFGVASAPAIFQRLIEQTISGIPGCINYLDDIICTGETEEEHLNNLRLLFQRLKDSGFRCNYSKCCFLQPKVEYLGHIIDSSGIFPSESGTEAIKNLPRPKNISELQSFMGKINYYCSFIKNYSTICGPLNLLRKKNQKFVWGVEQEKAFHELKKQLIELAQLVHFDENLPIVLATDASSYGIGAVISHIYPDGLERPIAYASKTLNDHQKNYSQIEKEGLSIIFGVQKFHQYLYGRKFILYTDHKPLVSIFNPAKGIHSTTAHRLQRWALILASYNYEIRYKSTKQHGNADALSRLPYKGDSDFDDLIEVNDIMVEEQLDSFPIDSEKVAEYSKKDKILCKVYHYVMNGWPEKITETELLPYFRHRLNLTQNKGVLIMQTEYSRIVIPKQLRENVLQMIHQGHWGIVRMKQISRRYCWWPGIDEDIAKVVSSCHACNVCTSDPPKEFTSWPESTSPWQRIHLDYAGPFKDHMWLIVVDSYSQFPYVAKMKNATSTSTIKSLQSIFAIEGLPETIISDNGTQFSSKEFNKFCEINGIQHLTTAPFHPASNGLAERFVRSFKTCLEKELASGNDLNSSLLAYLTTYRSTPNKDGKSPAEIIHGRQPRTLLSLLKPSVNTSNKTQNVDLKHFKVNDQVLCKNFGSGEKWLHGIILKRLGSMMYLIQVGNKTIRRHKNQLKGIKTEFKEIKTEPQFIDVNYNARQLLENCFPRNIEVPYSFPEEHTTSAASQQTSSYELPSTSHQANTGLVNPTIQRNENALPASPPVLRRSERMKRKPDRFSPVITQKLARRN